MKSKILKKQKRSTFIFVGFVFAVLFLCFICRISHLPMSQFIQNKSVFLIANIASFYNEEKITTPTYLRIPTLDIEANIKSVGRTFTGEVGVPKKPDDVAWFNQGPRPGEIGSAIISGHYGWKDNRQAVFDNLAQLKKGDRLYVEDNQGTTTTFVVTKIQRYSSNNNTLKVFSSNDGKAHLNLITCEGVWNSISQSYSQRLVVFTDKE